MIDQIDEAICVQRQEDSWQLVWRASSDSFFQERTRTKTKTEAKTMKITMRKTMTKDKAIGVHQSEDSWQLLAVVLFSKKEQGLDACPAGNA